MNTTEINIASEVRPACNGFSALRVVLHESYSPSVPYVTHIENMDLGGCSWGHYSKTLEEAIKDYISRCREYGVDPGPEVEELLLQPA